MSPESKTRVLYVGGEGRSGSTVLSSMLGNVDGYLPVGELRGIWQAVLLDELCGCGEPFSRCDLWTEIGAHAFGGWDTIDAQAMRSADAAFLRHRAVPRQTLRRTTGRRPAALDAHMGVLSTLYRSIGEVTGCRAIVDSTKDPSYALLLRDVSSVDLKVVHLIRDSRGVAYSWMKTDVARPEYSHLESLKDSVMESRRPWRSAVEWTAKNLLFESFWGTPLIRVNYERLVDDPSGALHNIIAFAEGTSEITDIPHAFEARPFHSLGGNRVRFRRGQITPKADVAWTTEMPQGARRTVTGITAPLLARYGYLSPSKVRPHANAG